MGFGFLRNDAVGQGRWTWFSRSYLTDLVAIGSQTSSLRSHPDNVLASPLCHSSHQSTPSGVGRFPSRNVATVENSRYASRKLERAKDSIRKARGARDRANAQTHAAAAKQRKKKASEAGGWLRPELSFVGRCEAPGYPSAAAPPVGPWLGRGGAQLKVLWWSVRGPAWVSE